MTCDCLCPALAARLGTGRRTRAALTAAAFFAGALSALPAAAGMEEGRQKAAACAPCHGADGNSTVPLFPSIAGQPRQFIEMSLIMFREGRRINEAMKPLVDKMSNADVRDLAQYFAAQKMAPPAQQPGADVAARGREITEKKIAMHVKASVGRRAIAKLSTTSTVARPAPIGLPASPITSW